VALGFHPVGFHVAVFLFDVGDRSRQLGIPLLFHFGIVEPSPSVVIIIVVVVSVLVIIVITIVITLSLSSHCHHHNW